MIIGKYGTTYGTTLSESAVTQLGTTKSINMRTKVEQKRVVSAARLAGWKQRSHAPYWSHPTHKQILFDPEDRMSCLCFPEEGWRFNMSIKEIIHCLVNGAKS